MKLSTIPGFMTGHALHLMCMTGEDCLRDMGTGHAKLEFNGISVKLQVYARVMHAPCKELSR